MTVFQRYMIKADNWSRQAILAAACGDHLGAEMNQVRANVWRDKAMSFSIKEGSEEYAHG